MKLPSKFNRTFAWAAALALVLHSIAANAALGDAVVDQIYAQPNPFTNTPNAEGLNASGLKFPHDAAFDAAGNLYVADTGNHRVLCYLSPATTDRVADRVIGQPDFNSNQTNNGGVSASSLSVPGAIAVTASGDLYVADYDNHRVLGFRRPLVEDAVADVVIGQPDFASKVGNNGGRSASSLLYPAGVAVDAAGNLWVSDLFNYRVLEYNNPLGAGDRAADFVIGQPDFQSGEPNAGGLGAQSLLHPAGLAVDARGNLWVADSGNHRVLGYDEPLRLGASADRVLGQPSFNSGVANYTGAVSASGLRSPEGVSVDRNGNVYVSDSGNNRALMFYAPAVTLDRTADVVHGQLSFESGDANNGGITGQTTNYPSAVAIHPSGSILVVDYVNNRLKFLETPLPLVTSIQVKVAPSTGRAKLVVRGLGMVSGSAYVEVNGTPLATTRYKDVAADGTAGRLIASDADFDGHVPPGVPVRVTIVNRLTGVRSAPIPFAR